MLCIFNQSLFSLTTIVRKTLTFAFTMLKPDFCQPQLACFSMFLSSWDPYLLCIPLNVSGYGTHQPRDRGRLLPCWEEHGVVARK